MFEARTIESPFYHAGEYSLKLEFPAGLILESPTSLDIIGNRESQSKIAALRARELKPAKAFWDEGRSSLPQMTEQYVQGVRYFNMPFLLSHQQSRPLADGLSVGRRQLVDCYLNTPNDQLFKASDYELKHAVNENKYLNTCAVPFNQSYFNQQGPKPLIGKSALESEEKRMKFQHAAKILAMFHHMQKRNEVLIDTGVPCYGSELVQAIEVPLICQDGITTAQKYKLTTTAKLRLNPQRELRALYEVPSAVFNSCCSHYER